MGVTGLAGIALAIQIIRAGAKRWTLVVALVSVMAGLWVAYAWIVFMVALFQGDPTFDDGYPQPGIAWALLGAGLALGAIAWFAGRHLPRAQSLPD